MVDVQRERSLTPGCLRGPFLDSAGSSLPPTPVVDTVVAHLRREAEVGGYRAAAERAEDLAAVPASVARLLGCSAAEVALSDSATRAWATLVTAVRWRPGDRVLVCGNEYASNAIALLQRGRYDGVRVEVVPSGPDGSPDPEAFDALLDERVRLVSLVHVATNSGSVLPVRRLADAARAVGALVLLDACQSVGQVPVDVGALGVDALTATGRKWLRGPRGTGFLYVRAGLVADLEPAAADLRGAVWAAPDRYDLRPDATRFELWEADLAGRLGLGAAVDHLLALGVDDVAAVVAARAATLRAGLAAVDGVTVHDRGLELAGIVTFTVAGRPPAAVKQALADVGVTVSVSGAASTLIDMSERGLEAVVRASPHCFVTEDDVARAVDEVARLVS